MASKFLIDQAIADANNYGLQRPKSDFEYLGSNFNDGLLMDYQDIGIASDSYNYPDRRQLVNSGTITPLEDDFIGQPQGIVNVDQVKNLIANAQRNNFKNFYGNPDQLQGFVDRGNPLPIEPKQSLRNIINSQLQNAKTNVGQKVGKGIDFMGGIKDYISQGGMLGMATKGIGSLLRGLGDALGFEDRQLSGGEGSIIDEYGYVYNSDDLNKMNALGGYYTDPARSARRRQKRIANMLARKEANKKYSISNLKRLQEQEAAQEKARMAGQVAAAQNDRDRQNIQNIQNYTGRSLSDYRMSQPASQRNYTGAGKSGMGRNNPYYADGGLASMFTRRG